MASLADFVLDRSAPKRYNRRLTAEFPRLADVLVDDARRLDYEGGGQSEFFPRDERNNPYPGQDVVQVYSPRQRGLSLKNLLFGERLHKMGDERIGDPKWLQLKREFWNLLDPETQAFFRQKHAYYTMPVDARPEHMRWRSDREHRNFEPWRDQSELDQWIGALFNPPNEEWRNVRWSPEILAWRDRAERYLRGE